MSWSINVCGKPEDVKAVINADAHLPQPLKDAVALFADAGSNATRAIHVKSSGHFEKGTAWSNINEFTINSSVVIAPPAPAPTPPA